MAHEIAYLVNQYPAPSHTFIRREILALERRGWKIHRFTHRVSEAPLTDSADHAEFAKTTVLLGSGAISLLEALLRRVVRSPMNTFRALVTSMRMALTGERRFIAHLGYFLLACALAENLRVLGIRRLHAHFSINSADVAYLCSILADIEYGLTIHATYEYDDPKRRLNLAEKVARARFVVAISEHGHRTLIHRFPEWAGKIRLIRCGLDSCWLATADYSIADSKQLVCVARLEEQKNLALLIRSAALLRHHGIMFRLLLVGDGSLRPQLDRMITENELSQYVHLAGWCDQREVARTLVESLALVLSSDSEGIPTAVLEAFACRRPAICTDVGGVREVIHPGSTGWLVPKGNAEALFEAMRECLETPPEKLLEMGDSGRIVLEAFRIEKSAELLEEAWLHDS